MSNKFLHKNKCNKFIFKKNKNILFVFNNVFFKLNNNMVIKLNSCFKYNYYFKLKQDYYNNNLWFELNKPWINSFQIFQKKYGVILSSNILLICLILLWIYILCLLNVRCKEYHNSFFRLGKKETKRNILFFKYNNDFKMRFGNYCYIGYLDFIKYFFNLKYDRSKNNNILQLQQQLLPFFFNYIFFICKQNNRNKYSIFCKKIYDNLICKFDNDSHFRNTIFVLLYNFIIIKLNYIFYKKLIKIQGIKKYKLGLQAVVLPPKLKKKYVVLKSSFVHKKFFNQFASVVYKYFYLHNFALYTSYFSNLYLIYNYVKLYFYQNNLNKDILYYKLNLK